MPLETAVAAPKATIDPAMYVPPALRYGSAGACLPPFLISHMRWSLLTEACAPLKFACGFCCHPAAGSLYALHNPLGRLGEFASVKRCDPSWLEAGWYPEAGVAWAAWGVSPYTI